MGDHRRADQRSQLNRNTLLKNIPTRQKRQRRTVSTALSLLGAGNASGSDRDALLESLQNADSRILESQPLLDSSQRFIWSTIEGDRLPPSPSLAPFEASTSSYPVPRFERVELGDSDDEDDAVEYISEELYEKTHRKYEYEEKRMRRLEKEQLYHERYKLHEKQEALEQLELEDSDDMPQEIIALSSGISAADRPLAYVLQQKLLYENDKMLERYDQLLKPDYKGKTTISPYYRSTPSPFDVRSVGDKSLYNPSPQMRNLEVRVFKRDMQSPLRVKLKIPPSTKKIIAMSQKSPKSPLSQSILTAHTLKSFIKPPSALMIAADARLKAPNQEIANSRKSHRSLVAFGVNIPNEIDKHREFSLIDAADGFGIWSGVGQEYNAKSIWEEAISCRVRGEKYDFSSKKIVMPETKAPSIGTISTPRITSNRHNLQSDTQDAKELKLWQESPFPPQSPSAMRKRYAEVSTPKRGRKRKHRDSVVESAKKVPGRGRGRPPKNKADSSDVKGEKETEKKPTIKGNGITYVYGAFRGRRKITDPLVQSFIAANKISENDLKKVEVPTKTKSQAVEEHRSVAAELESTPKKPESSAKMPRSTLDIIESSQENLEITPGQSEWTPQKSQSTPIQQNSIDNDEENQTSPKKTTKKSKRSENPPRKKQNESKSSLHTQVHHKMRDGNGRFSKN
ncbi:hypothetical protein E3Q19_02634 [Wallemia mellicola]|nr:hypothetical protein E3Q19_02634 [Wallemia mellicola]TIC73808.1 hypothetical protein E3Q00_02601 [Wallemia mellicola]